MAKNGIYTPYDDAGFPLNAAFTTQVTLTSSLTGQVIKGAPGRFLKVSVNTALAGSGGTLVFYDNASAASGTILLTIPVASGTLGTVFSIDLPCVAGLYMANPSGTLTAGEITIGYS
jgi:hypothetical protein